MLSIPVLKQDFKINARRILGVYMVQICSLLLAAGICEMKLIEISDIFWDTIPVVLAPMAMQMILACEVVQKRSEDGTIDFILATQISPEKMIHTKILFMTLNTAMLFGLSVILGCICRVYSLTGVWEQKTYLLLNLGGFCLQMFVGGFCFLVSCTGRGMPFYLKLAVGLPAVEYLLYLGYYLMPELFFLKYMSVFSLFQHDFFSKQSVLLWIVTAGFLILGAVFFALGRYVFLFHRKSLEDSL